jgi:hypothetical protein
LLLLWLLPLFIIDVATRRIAWDFEAMWRSMNQRARSLQAVFATREVDAERTLSALKAGAGRREENRAAAKTPETGRPSGAAPSAPSTPIELEPVRPDRKFEASPSAKPSGDLSSALGGARNEPGPGPAPTAGAKPSGPAKDAQTTRSLLEAKRRAREKMDES